MSGAFAQTWAQQLGLTATPLFGRERPEARFQHLALLDGVRASFLLSDEASAPDLADAPDWAWSANVRHHVSLQSNKVVLSRSSGSVEVLDRESVESKRPEFLRYLEGDDFEQTVGSIDHVVRTFRRHRAELRGERRRPIAPDLPAFLYLLALAQESDPVGAHAAGDVIAKKYAIEDFDTKKLTNDYIHKFVYEVTHSQATNRRLRAPITIRLAGGMLFQEAHAEVLTEPVQLTLFGLAEAGQQRLDLSSGVYYTPVGLARTLTEIAIRPYLQNAVIRISDPACGSGIFLCEAVRALQRHQYQGRIILTGRDISSPAIQMARFSIACALLDWRDHKVEWSIDQGSFLKSRPPRDKPDVVLMNPPFLSWEALSTEQKEDVRWILGAVSAGRPDLSTAFVQKALAEVAEKSTVATLLPRGALDSQKGKQWRDSILSRNDARLIGTFGDHGLFRHAMVSVSAAVFQRPAIQGPAVMVWADERPNSAELALRALRLRLETGNRIEEERTPRWAIYQMKANDLSRRSSWLPTPSALGSLLEVIERHDMPRLADLFRVKQGIKTGLNKAFLLSEGELGELPRREHKFFRAAVSGEDIVGGRIRTFTHIFYVPGLFDSKKELLEAVPVFGRKIVKYEERLKRRPKSNPKRWWEPIWPRPELARNPAPRILTKMFGATDMAAVDMTGMFLPLQAFAWIPNWSAIAVEPELREAALWWYCRILNSSIFFLLRREMAAAMTSGGQLDVSPKYVSEVPLPIPTSDELVRLAAIREPDVSASKENDEMVAMIYGTDPAAWPVYEKSS